MKIVLLTISLISASALIAQKTNSLPPQVYNWNNLKVIKEDTRIRRQIMEGSTTSLAHFEALTSTLEPGKAPHPPHLHADEEELIIVNEGQVKITINGVAK